MDDKRCGTCTKWTADPEFDGNGLCGTMQEIIGHMRGTDCRAYRPIGQKTTRARMLVAAFANGETAAIGWDGITDPDDWCQSELAGSFELASARLSWCEVDVPLPEEPETVEGVVVS